LKVGIAPQCIPLVVCPPAPVKVCVPKELTPGERRVALVPDVAKKLVDGGFELLVQRGAGAEAGLLDPAYEEAGATIVPEARELLSAAGVVTKVQKPLRDEVAALPRGAALIGFLQPLTDAELVKALADAGVTSFAMEAIPRTTRAQSMDALSSQAVCPGQGARARRGSCRAAGDRDLQAARRGRRGL
jgi:proton-translocating NAD(P)+ transhydrogenase subunit alpha